MPPKHLEADSARTGEEVATKMEGTQERAVAQTSEDDTASFGDVRRHQIVDAYAFAFDIDGVLVKGGAPIPEAVEAMRVLNGENDYGVKV